MLEYSDVTASYQDLVALRDVSCRVAAGERVALLGHNGAGKTTFLKCAMGALESQVGQVSFNGALVNRGEVHRNARAGLGFVPQGHNVFPNLSVAQNLNLSGLVHGLAELERVYKLFPLLRERRLQRAGLLSGGQQQMLALGMALMTKPACLLLDEPTTGLAPVIVRDVFHALRQVNEANGTTMVVVEQNVQAALDFADRAIVLKSGRKIFDGPSSELRERGDLWELF